MPDAPAPRPARIRRGDARPALLDVALSVFRAQGYAGTSVDDLCRAAGVTKGAFFHHFRSKDDLAVAAADYWSENAHATVGLVLNKTQLSTHQDSQHRHHTLAKRTSDSMDCQLNSTNFYMLQQTQIEWYHYVHGQHTHNILTDIDL